MTVNAALLTREYSGGRAVTGQANGVIYGTVELGMDGAPKEILQNPPQCLVHVSMQWHPHRP